MEKISGIHRENQDKQDRSTKTERKQQKQKHGRKAMRAPMNESEDGRRYEKLVNGPSTQIGYGQANTACFRSSYEDRPQG